MTWSRKDGDVGFGVKFFDQHGTRRYERCGLQSEGWSRRRAEIELANFEALVTSGLYTPTGEPDTSDDRDPKFGPFARSFLKDHAVEIRPNTRAFYDNLLEHQLAPYFEDLRLSQITWSTLDSYKKQRLMLMHRSRAARASGGAKRAAIAPRLSERTINHSISLLSMILEEANRRPDIALQANPARDRKLRVKVQAVATRDWLEPDEVMSLLAAAEEIDNPVGAETDRKAQEVRRLRDRQKLTVKQVAAELGISEGGVCWLYERRKQPHPSPRRAIIATLSASGTRNTELCNLRWQDLDFQHAKIRIQMSKTNKGVREIDMTPWLRAELLRYKLSVGDDPAPSDPVFPTRAGTFRDKDNLNRNVIGPIQRTARKQRAEQGLPPLPTRLSAQCSVAHTPRSWPKQARHHDTSSANSVTEAPNSHSRPTPASPNRKIGANSGRHSMSSWQPPCPRPQARPAPDSAPTPPWRSSHHRSMRASPIPHDDAPTRVPLGCPDGFRRGVVQHVGRR